MLLDAAPQVNLIVAIFGMLGTAGLGYVIRGVFRSATREATDPAIKDAIASEMKIMTAQVATQFAEFRGGFKDELIRGINGTYVRSREDEVRRIDLERRLGEFHAKFSELHTYAHETRHDMASKLTALEFVAESVERIEKQLVPGLGETIDALEGDGRRHQRAIEDIRTKDLVEIRAQVSDVRLQIKGCPCSMDSRR